LSGCRTVRRICAPLEAGLCGRPERLDQDAASQGNAGRGRKPSSAIASENRVTVYSSTSTRTIEGFRDRVSRICHQKHITLYLAGDLPILGPVALA